MAPSTPLVSVVMPAFNASRTIGDAIRSVLEGTLPDFEIIVCNDASTDETAAIVAEFTDRRVKIIHNEKNMGEGASRDRAIELAAGQWIAVLDADDQFTPERLHTLVEIAKLHPEAIVFDDLMDCHDTPSGLKPWRAIRSNGAWSRIKAPQPVTIADWIIQNRTLIKPLIPREHICRHGVRHSDKRFAEDLEFFLNLFAKTRAPLFYVPQPAYLYRLSAGSMSTLPDRYTMLAETLENAIPLFHGDNKTTAAIQLKAKSIRRNEIYQKFFMTLMRRQFSAACKAAVRAPWVPLEFAKRSALRIPYHFSRWRVNGAKRSTS